MGRAKELTHRKMQAPGTRAELFQKEDLLLEPVQLFRKYDPWIRSVVKNICRGRHGADDIDDLMQLGRLKVWQVFEKFDRYEAPRSVAYVAIRNAITDEWKNRRREMLLFPGELPAEEQMGELDGEKIAVIRERVLAAIEALRRMEPGELGMADLFWMENATQADIGLRLETSKGIVQRRLATIQRHLVRAIHEAGIQQEEECAEKGNPGPGSDAPETDCKLARFLEDIIAGR